MSEPSDRVQGALDLLLLTIVSLELLHGWAIGQRLKQFPGDALQVSSKGSVELDVAVRRHLQCGATAEGLMNASSPSASTAMFKRDQLLRIPHWDLWQAKPPAPPGRS